MDYRYRNFARRFSAALIDGIIFVPVNLLLNEIPVTSNAAFFFLAFLQSCLFGFYMIYCHKTYGKTIGKWITAIEVIHVSETRRLSFTEAFRRDGPELIIDLMLILFFATRSNNVDINFDDYLSASENWAFAWVLLEFITMQLNKKSRALHDYLGSSVVVRSNLREVPVEQV